MTVAILMALLAASAALNWFQFCWLVAVVTCDSCRRFAFNLLFPALRKQWKWHE